MKKILIMALLSFCLVSCHKSELDDDLFNETFKENFIRSGEVVDIKPVACNTNDAVEAYEYVIKCYDNDKNITTIQKEKIFDIRDQVFVKWKNDNYVIYPYRQDNWFDIVNDR